MLLDLNSDLHSVYAFGINNHMPYPRIEIWYDNPPSTGGLTIRREMSHPIWGKMWIERRLTPRGGRLGTGEAAKFLGVSVVWLFKLVKVGTLRPRKKGGRLVFRLRELQRYKDSKKKKDNVARRGPKQFWFAH